jgi:hypothetical protein
MVSVNRRQKDVRCMADEVENKRLVELRKRNEENASLFVGGPSLKRSPLKRQPSLRR